MPFQKHLIYLKDMGRILIVDWSNLYTEQFKFCFIQSLKKIY